MTIRTSFDAFKLRFKDVDYLEAMKDEVGQYGIRFRNATTRKHAIFCFKNSMKGRIVSVHYSMYDEARKNDTPIVLGLGEKYFYLFTANDIDRERGTLPNKGINYKEDGTMMINFPITCGKSLQKPRERKQKAKGPQGPDPLENHPLGAIFKQEFPDLERVS